MSKFDEFDLDLQAVKSNNTPGILAYSDQCTVTYNCTTAIINSIAYCTQNGQYNTCLCSTCCTGYTYGPCSNAC